MKKTMKKILASVIAAAMILTAAPLSGIAKLDLSGLFAPKASALEASGQLTDTITYTFDESTGKLTISGTGEMPDFAPNYSSGNPVTLISPFEEAGSIRSVSFSEGITKIGSSTFGFCSNLTDVEFADSIKEIGDTAFGACGFESICIPDTVEKVGFSVFVACENLTQAEFAEGFNGEFVLGYNDSEWVNSVFDGCNNLRTVYIPESMEVLGSKMFNHCDSLSDIYYAGSRSEWENIEIGDNADALSNTTIHYGKSVANSLSDTVFWEFDEATYTIRIFGEGATPDYDTSCGLNSPITNADLFFSDVIIEEGITRIGDALFFDSSVENVQFADSVESIGKNAFGYCVGLEEFNIPKTVKTVEGGAFYGSYDLGEITVDPDNPYLCSVDGVLYNKDMTSLICYPGGKADKTEFVLPDSVETVEPYAFGENRYIKKVVLSDNTSELSTRAFAVCELDELDLGKCLTVLHTDLFFGGSVPGVLHIPETLTTIEDDVFYDYDDYFEIYYAGSSSQWNAITVGDNNDGLSAATIHYGKVDTSGALSETVSYTYDKDTGVLTISGTGAIPTYVSASASPFAGREFSEIIIEEGITEIGSYAFPNCDIGTLTTPITLDNVKDNAFVGSTADNIIVNYYLGEDGAFDVGETGNEMLADPSSFEEYVYEIVTDTITACYNGKTMGLTYSGTGAIPDYSSEEWGTFSGTGEVHSVVFEEGITHIGDYSLVLCNGIESIILPDSLESIGEYAFALDAGLKTVTIGKNLTEIGLAAFTGCYSLEAFNVSADNTAFCSVDGVLYSKDRKELVLYPAGKEDTEFEIPAGTETLCAAAFAECDNLTKVTIPTSVTEIDKGVFNGMDALTDVYYLGTQAEWENITMGDSNTSLRDVTMHYAVGGQLTDTTSWIYNETTQTLTITGTGDCKYDFNYDGETYDFAIKNVVFDTETYNGGYELVFEDLCNAESFRFTSTVTNINISEETHNFCYFYELETIYVDEDNALYESIDGVLFDSVNKKLLVYPAGRSESVYSVPEGTVSIGEVAFYGADMDEVILPDSLIILDYLAFFSCGINRIDLNNVKEVGRQAFLFNESISEVSFGESLESIKSEAFHCTALTNAVIPASVKELQINSFSSLKLESVTFEEGFDFITDEYDVSYVRVFDVSVISRLYLPSSITNIPYGLFYDAEIIDVYYNGTPEQWARIEIGENNEALENAEIHFAKIGGKITDTTSWTYNEETQTLTITGTGDSKISYNYNGETYDFEIKNVVIDTEAYSGDYEYVFDNFCNAESFRFTSKVSDIDVSENGVCFCNFYKLKSFIVDEDNSVYESIDGVLFDSVNNALLVYPIGKSGSVYTVPDGTVAIGDFAFMASYITEVILPDSLESIGYLAFNLCWNLSSIDLNHVKYVDDQAFLSCYSLSDVDFGDSLESVGSEAFANTGLKNVVIPASVKELWSSSFGILELESVTFEEGFDFCNNKTQGSGELLNVFNSSTISKLYLPSSITNVYAHLFRYCDEIQDVYFNGTAVEWAEIGIGEGNEALENAEMHFAKIGGQLSDTVGWTYDEATKTLTFRGTGSLPYDYTYSGETYDFEIKTIVYDEGITELFCIPAFSNKGAAEIINISSTVENAEYNYGYDFDSLKEINVAEGNSNYCSIDGVLYSADKTVLVAYPNGKEAERFVIPESVTNFELMALANCKGITELVFSGNVKNIGMEDCRDSGFEKVDLYGVETIGSQAFFECENLTEVVFYDSLREIGGEAFGECSIDNVVIPAGTVFYATSFEGFCFESFTLADGYDFNIPPRDAGYNGFYAKNLYIPSSVTKIPDNFFYDCGFDDIWFDGTAAEWAEIEIGIGNEALENAEIHFAKIGGKLSETVGWTYDEDTETLTICGTGTYDPYKFKGEKYDFEIKHIVYDEGITEYFYLGNIFENIYNVETLHLASTVTGGFTNYDGSYGSIEFDVMTGLEDITVAEGNPAFCSVEGVMFNSDKTVILAYSNHGRTSYTIPETVTKITACFQRSGLEEIIFTGNVKEITVEAFWASEQLVRADLTGVEEIDDMAFMWCENLSEVIFDDNLKYIGHEAFTDCAFTEIVIPAGMEYFTSSSFNTMGFDTFRFEEGFDFDPETDYRSGCGFVAKEMYIPSSVTNIPEKFMNDETCAKKIYYNGTMAEWKAIDIGTDNDGILYSEIVCTDGTLNQLNPNAFYIFDDETGTLTISGEGEFRRIERPWIDYESDNCSPFAGDSSIKTLVVEEGITLLGDGLFDRCSGIREVYLPESLEEINDNTFFGCMWITDVYYNGTAAEWANIRIAESNYDLVNANIHFLGDVVAFTEDSGIEVQTVDGVTYVNGFNPGTTVDEISAMTEEGWTVSVETADGSDRIGTGSVITMTNGDVTVEYVAVVYGDTTGDSWYNGQDALITSCMVNGMLDETTAGAAVTSAADCNHDGVVDDLDVEILRQAGVLLASVDQTKSEEELITTSSAYVEYLNLIDQTIETDTAVETEVVEDTPTAEDEPVSINWFEMIVSFLKMLLNFVYGLFIL